MQNQILDSRYSRPPKLKTWRSAATNMRHKSKLVILCPSCQLNKYYGHVFQAFESAGPSPTALLQIFVVASGLLSSTSLTCMSIEGWSNIVSSTSTSFPSQPTFQMKRQMKRAVVVCCGCQLSFKMMSTFLMQTRVFATTGF